MTRVWREVPPDRPGGHKPIRYTQAVLVLEWGLPFAAVHCGWWRYEYGARTRWVLWRPRWYRRAIRQGRAYGGSGE